MLAHPWTAGIALGLAVAFIAGCSGRDSSDGPPTPVDTLSRSAAPARLAATTCRLWLRDCGCRWSPFSSFEQCNSASSGFLEGQFSEAEAAGLTYDPDCAAEWLNALEGVIACNRLSDLTGDAARLASQPTCKMFSGTAGEGAACERVAPSGDNCAPELLCLGMCMANPFPPAPTIRAEGESCDIATEACELGTRCVPDLADPMVRSCVREPGDGAPCTFGCDVGFHCDRADGATEGVCRPPPPTGSPCARTTTTAPCALGSYCGVDDICLDATPEGAPCSDDDECGAMFECAEIRSGTGEDRHLCMPEEAVICI